MKVKEYIKKLEEFNGDANIYIITSVKGENIGAEIGTFFLSEDANYNDKKKCTEVYITTNSLDI